MVIEEYYDIDYVIAEDLMKNLIMLSKYLASSMTSAGSVSNFPEIYKEAREKFVVNSLKEIYKAAKDQEQAFNLRSTRYEKGSTLIIPYYKRLSGLMNVHLLFLIDRERKI